MGMYRPNRKIRGILAGGVSGILLASNVAVADQVSATIEALRLDAMITGGATPYNDTAGVFQKMVNDINQTTPDYSDAAIADTNSLYFQYYLPRRMAKEMMTPQMSESGVQDSAATTLIMANLAGIATRPSIKTLWSQNASFCFIASSNLSTEDGTGPDGAPGCAAGQFTPYFMQDYNTYAYDWRTILAMNTGQYSMNANQGSTPAPIQSRDVGGYMTAQDNVPGGIDFIPITVTFSSFAFSGGTNLRAVEALYEISMGLTLQQMAYTPGVTAQVVPRFIPSNNPNFTTGQGQLACIACHGGGVSNLTHGYSTFADLFDWSPTGGLVYSPSPIYSPNPAVGPGTTTGDPAEGLGKSFGSNPNFRLSTYTCNQAAGAVCNPSSNGIGTSQGSQGWDLTTWGPSGSNLLSQMGWTGATSGNGLNSLGAAVGQATLVYQFMVERVVNEICPLGTFSASQINTIATQAQTIDNAAQAPALGPYAYIVTQVATNTSCL